MKRQSVPQELRRFLISILVASFVLNWLWEMAQMPAYREIALRPWRATASLCSGFEGLEILARVFCGCYAAFEDGAAIQFLCYF